MNASKPYVQAEREAESREMTLNDPEEPNLQTLTVLQEEYGINMEEFSSTTSTKERTIA